MRRSRSALNGDSGVSSLVEFLIIVMPFIATLFMMMEIANISHVRMTMGRGLQEALVKTSTSPHGLQQAARWEDFGTYILSRAVTNNQYDTIEFVRSEAALDAREAEPGRIIAYVEASSADTPVGAHIYASGTAGGGIFVRSSGLPAATNPETPPTISVRVKGGYRYLTGFFSWFTVGPAPDWAIEMEMISVNEHPDYERGEL